MRTLLWAAPEPDPVIEGLRLVEVASVADAMEQLYGQRAYMAHQMRPLAAAKFAGPAVTVLMKKDEHHEGAAASQGILHVDAIVTVDCAIYVNPYVAARTDPAPSDIPSP